MKSISALNPSDLDLFRRLCILPELLTAAGVGRLTVDEDDLVEFCVPEAAQAPGLKESTIRAWLLRRRIGFVKLSSRCVRIPHTEVGRLIRENTIPAREVR